MKTLPLTEVKTHFPRLVKGVEEREDAILVTRNGYPSAVILNYDEFKRLKETIEVLSDKKLMEQITKSRAYFKKGKKGLSLEEVFD